MGAKKFFTCWFFIVLICTAATAGVVYYVDPYFHYRAPRTDKFYYELDADEQRSQNDGILKHFEYDAIITGTSLTENFKTSEMDALWGVNSVKASYGGATFKEVNDSLGRALKTHPDTRMVIRSLEQHFIMNDADSMRVELGNYPTYLYDDNPYNDVNYLLHKRIAAKSLLALIRYAMGRPGGITSFDEYSNWSDEYTYGKDVVIPEGIYVDTAVVQKQLTQEDRETIEKNITQNVTDLVRAYPQVEFYYFLPPYSVVYWGVALNGGDLERLLQAEEYALDMMLDIDNLHIYSFMDSYDITTNLDNYRDSVHYNGWVNSYILESMHAGEHLLTRENYREYLEREREFYSTYDYNAMNMDM